MHPRHTDTRRRMANCVHKESEKAPKWQIRTMHMCTAKAKMQVNKERTNEQTDARVHSYWLKLRLTPTSKINGNKWCRRLFIDTCYNVFYFNVLVLYSTNNRVYVCRATKPTEKYRQNTRQKREETNWKYFREFVLSWAERAGPKLNSNDRAFSTHHTVSFVMTKWKCQCQWKWKTNANWNCRIANKRAHLTRNTNFIIRIMSQNLNQITTDKMKKRERIEKSPKTTTEKHCGEICCDLSVSVGMKILFSRLYLRVREWVYGLVKKSVYFWLSVIRWGNKIKWNKESKTRLTFAIFASQFRER